jgi:hypothetical protein
VNQRYPLVAERADHCCEYCRAPERVFNFQLQVEHIRPRTLDGGDDLENLALACGSCNVYKSDAVQGHDAATGERAPLFHPRQQDWHDHFVLDEETAEIRGRTPIGRATVARLKLNSAFQIRARRDWMRFSLYP